MIATVLDRFPVPACARLLGLDIREADAGRGWVRVAFDARPEFCNAAGSIQGGMLTAMLDDAIGPAVLIHTDAAVFPTTIDLHVSFLAPARPGLLFAEASVVQLGGAVGFAEASLFDADGAKLAKANASLRLRRLEQALPAAG